jgi:hypothetical protein
MISSLCRELDETWTILGYYAACNGNSLPEFRDNLSGSSSRLNKMDFWPLKIGLIGCPETSVRNYHYTLRNIPEEIRSQ